MATVFDTLSYTRSLEEAGVDRKTAEAHAKAIRDLVMAELVTKSDLREAMLQLTIRLGSMIGAMLAVAVAVLAVVIKA